MLSTKVSRADLPLAAVWVLLRRLVYGGFLVALVALAAALSAAVVPRLFGYPTLVVQGGSMRESVPNGSPIIARWLAAEEVALGNVILVQEESDDSPARPRIHRVVSLDEEEGHVLVRTKGDANETADPGLYILPDRVLTPVYTLPYLGYLTGFVVTPLGWAILVALPATLLCIVTLRGIWTGGGKVGAEQARHRERKKPPLGLTLLVLMCGALMIGALNIGVSVGLFTDTVSVPGNSFTTAASFG